jgi:hypothetical protein
VPVSGKILSIENIGEDWYWDIQVPNTNNYVCSGHVHHNSAKSILMAHLIVTHCLNNDGARGLLARKSLPDLKDTIFKEVVEHLQDDPEKVGRVLVEGKDYWINESTAKITFSNGSEIISRSWADRKTKKGRSLKLSFIAFEELTENDIKDREAFMTFKARLRRIPHIKENVLIAATNPDSPSHWVYKYFFDERAPTRFVFKSVTTDNPFLDPVYVQQLKQDLDERAAQRYVYGEWVDLHKDQVYYSYNKEENFRSSFEHIGLRNVKIAHDFNIGADKPMSATLSVLDNGTYHAVKSFHIDGARTVDILEEIVAWERFEEVEEIEIYGDASGKNRDTRNIKSDYDIIKEFWSNYKKKNGDQVKFVMKVPASNPPLRRRHNIVNAYFKNANNDVRLYLYDDWLHEGFMQTAFKKGADLVEDDSLPQQHATTTIGYMIDYDTYREVKKTTSRQL